jgi:hypothetical protein
MFFHFTHLLSLFQLIISFSSYQHLYVIFCLSILILLLTSIILIMAHLYYFLNSIYFLFIFLLIHIFLSFSICFMPIYIFFHQKYFLFPFMTYSNIFFHLNILFMTIYGISKYLSISYLFPTLRPNISTSCLYYRVFINESHNPLFLFLFVLPSLSLILGF